MSYLVFFFFNDTATTEIYTLSLHDALPIYREDEEVEVREEARVAPVAAHVRGRVQVDERRDARDHEDHEQRQRVDEEDRKSTRLNSSHANISYAVFCLKKKKKQNSSKQQLK